MRSYLKRSGTYRSFQTEVSVDEFTVLADQCLRGFAHVRSIEFSVRRVGRTFSKFPMTDKININNLERERATSNVHLTVEVPPRDAFLDLIHAKTSFMFAPLTSDYGLTSRQAASIYNAKQRSNPQRLYLLRQGKVYAMIQLTGLVRRRLVHACD